MDLRKATSRLIRSYDVGRWIELADNYIRLYNKMPQSFVLPVDHELLKPIIDAFASDAHAFCDYIKALRDGSSGKEYDDLHYLYRTISLRTLQNERRTRLRKAVENVLPTLERKLDRALNYQEKMTVGRVIEQLWGLKRLETLTAERSLRKADRLSAEERSEVLINFWRGLDRKLEEPTVMFTKEEINRMLKAVL